MQEGMQSEVFQKIQVSNRNRARLILQNKKLLSQIYKLQKIISSMIQKNTTNNIQLHQQSQELKSKFYAQIDEQTKLIQRLKKQVKQLKSSLTDNQIQEIKKQENQIVFLKKEVDKLFEERRIMMLKKNQKAEALQYYKPINNQTAQTLEKYKKLKSINAELKLKINDLERQIAKYHKYKELGKGFVPKQYDNPDYHFIKIDNQIKSMRKQMKKIQQKWRSKVQSLDKQYFSFKSILVDKNNSYENLQKQLKNLENRISGMRDMIQASLDRERINGIIISAQKKKQIQQILQEEKKKYKRLQTKNIEKKKSSPEKAKANIKQNFMKIIQEKNEQNKSQKLHQNVIPAQTHYSEKKKQENQKGIQQKILKPTKLVESIGVGTTFYYADD